MKIVLTLLFLCLTSISYGQYNVDTPTHLKLARTFEELSHFSHHLKDEKKWVAALVSLSDIYRFDPLNLLDLAAIYSNFDPKKIGGRHKDRLGLFQIPLYVGAMYIDDRRLSIPQNRRINYLLDETNNLFVFLYYLNIIYSSQKPTLGYGTSFNDFLLLFIQIEANPITSDREDDPAFNHWQKNIDSLWHIDWMAGVAYFSSFFIESPHPPGPNFFFPGMYPAFHVSYKNNQGFGGYLAGSVPFLHWDLDVLSFDTLQNEFVHFENTNRHMEIGGIYLWDFAPHLGLEVSLGLAIQIFIPSQIQKNYLSIYMPDEILLHSWGIVGGLAFRLQTNESIFFRLGATLTKDFLEVNIPLTTHLLKPSLSLSIGFSFEKSLRDILKNKSYTMDNLRLALY